jgi:hypothetical protein
MGGDCKMNKQVYVCDVCGAERKEANHWFVLGPPADCNPDAIFIISKWPHNVDMGWAKHVCGQVCAHKMIDEFLSR